ncbi:MAG: CRTAC1 family protein [Planctomycetota bacterium]
MIALGRMRTVGALDAIMASLQDAEKGVQEAACLALGLLAVAHLHRGMRLTSKSHHTPEDCILPFSPAVRHAGPEAVQVAIACLTRALEFAPENSSNVWLFNLAHGLAGSYPEQVTKRFLIPPSALASEHEIPPFHDIAPKLGLATWSLAGGAIMDDFDGDGLLDILTSSMNQSLGLRLFHNNGDGTFTDIAARSGLTGQRGGLNLLQLDYDNDGRLDVLVLRGGWMFQDGGIPNSLLRQGEDHVFRDTTRQAGIEIEAPTQTACVADIDLDGDLDLFMGYETQANAQIVNPNRLYRNRGDGTFEEITEKAGVASTLITKGAVFGDYDGDRWPDLYVSNFGAPNRLYRNQRNGTFVDVAPKLGVTLPIFSFPVWFFDFDNDADLDLWVSYYGNKNRLREFADQYVTRALPPDTVRLYENDGRGGFRDVTEERGMRRVFYPMGANFGDIDNDGYQDIYLGTGDPDFGSLWPNVMLHNDGGRRFQDVTASAGVGHLQKGHGIAFGDIDLDGDQDIFIQMGGAYFDDDWADCLFENPGHGNHWITVRLIGKTSNRYGVGSRIRVRLEERGRECDVFAFVGSGGSFGCNSLQQEIGLGQAERILRLEVFWPTTGRTQRFEEVPLDRFLEIEEHAPHPRVVERPLIRF